MRASPRSTTVQIIVVLLPGLASGETAEAVALETANGWGIGSRDVNNGALILLSMADREARIELGYGMQVPDSAAARIVADMMPRF